MLMHLTNDEKAWLRQFLVDRFNLSELKTLAFDLGVSYQIFLHSTLLDFARELLAYFERRNRPSCLVKAVLRRRPDSRLELFFGKLPACLPTKKVQIFVSNELPENVSELLEELAQILQVPKDEIELIAATWGSMRLLLSLPENTAYRLVTSKIIQVVESSLFDSLDSTSQNTWRSVVCDWPPVLQDSVLRPAISWKDAIAIKQPSHNGSTIILTVPYVPVFIGDDTKTKDRGEAVVESFSRALDLATSVASNSKVIIVLERKIKNQVATQGIKKIAHSKQCEILLCDEFETVGRWYRGIRKAFDGNCDKVLMLPGDIEKVADEKKFRMGLRDMIDRTKENTMIVGDYTSSDQFKEQFDPHLSHPLLQMMFPSSWPAIEQVGIKKMRSEYFCIGSKAFQAFQEQNWRWFPLDVTMLLMLAVVAPSNTASNYELERVDLGQISDASTRNINTALQQILRFGFQVWYNGHHTAAAKTIKDQTKLLIIEWWPIICRAMLDLLPLVET